MSKYEKPFFSINWSEVHTNRTTDTGIFDKLKDARKFAQDKKQGYIMRLAKGGTRVIEYFGGFKPSAAEEAKIKTILNNWNN